MFQSRKFQGGLAGAKLTINFITRMVGSKAIPVSIRPKPEQTVDISKHRGIAGFGTVRKKEIFVLKSVSI